ncbi:MAG: sigma-70 family RNA polymerase sigma factor [Elusimicrobiota bacterium]|nr:MAG: sigma-70 family RNA polymerase sigma factor [Elusimicrobiota bacterium]
MGEPRDEDLARRAAGGDDAAFAELVRRHAPRVRALCEATLGGPAEADDAAQETFLKAHRSLGRFDGRSAFATWLHRIAVNHCLDVLRAASRRRSESLDALLEADGAALGLALSEESPAKALEARDTAERLLARLNPEQRLALTLRETEGLSYEEIADAMSCSLDSVKARLRRARAELLEAARHFSDVRDV